MTFIVHTAGAIQPDYQTRGPIWSFISGPTSPVVAAEQPSVPCYTTNGVIAWTQSAVQPCLINSSVWNVLSGPTTPTEAQPSSFRPTIRPRRR